MRLLLDTHVVLWELGGTRTVGPGAQEALERATELLFSVVSFAEIGVKAAVGKLVVPRDIHEHITRTGIRILDHRDPFDRLLVSQARSEGLTVLTADPRIAEYDVSTLDAAS